MNKTIDAKLIYIANNDQQKYLFCRLKSLAESFVTNQSKYPNFEPTNKIKWLLNFGYQKLTGKDNDWLQVQDYRMEDISFRRLTVPRGTRWAYSFMLVHKVSFIV